LGFVQDTQTRDSGSKSVKVRSTGKNETVDRSRE